MWEKGNIVPPVAGAQNDDYPAALLSQSGCRALSFVLSRNLEPVSCNLGLCIPKTTLVVTAFGSGSVFATRDIHWHPSRFWLGGCHPRKRPLPPPPPPRKEKTLKKKKKPRNSITRPPVAPKVRRWSPESSGTRPERRSCAGHAPVYFLRIYHRIPLFYVINSSPRTIWVTSVAAPAETRRAGTLRSSPAQYSECPCAGARAR